MAYRLKIGSKPSASGKSNKTRKNERYSKKAEKSQEGYAQDILKRWRSIRHTIPKAYIKKIGITIWKKEHQDAIGACSVTSDLDSIVNRSGMGPTDYSTVCVVCGLTSECRGHYGSFRINENHRYKTEINNPSLVDVGGMVMNPIWAPYIIKVLTAVCNHCSTPYISEHKLRELGLDKIQETGKLITKISEKTNKNKLVCRRSTDDNPCPVNPEYSVKDKSDKGLIRINGNDIMPLQRAFIILSAITDEDAKLLGFRGMAHPRDMIIRTLLITPPKYRPSPVTDSGEVHQDPATVSYKKIVNSKNSEELWTSISSMYYKKGDAIGKNGRDKVIEAFKTKDGIVNKTQAGRQGNCSRTVLGGTVDCPPDSIIIPLSHAKALTVPERVADFNMKRLQDCVDQGQALYIFDDRNNFMRSKPNMKLKVGMLVHRNITDGDLVVFSRQPILTKLSISCLKTIVERDPRVKTNQMALSNTNKHNADFDGDEGNIQVLQEPGEMAEAYYLISTTENPTNPADGKPIVSYVMNQITFAYLCTSEETEIGKLGYLSLLDSIENYITDGMIEDLHRRLDNYGISRYSGRGVFSILLPPDYTLHFRRSGGEDVIIESGVLLQGKIDKGVLNSHNGIASTIIKHYGGEVHIRMLHMTALLGSKWLNQVGITVGPRDLPEIPEEMQERIDNAYYKLTDEEYKLGWTKKGRIEQNRRANLISATSDAQGKVLKEALELMKDTNLFKISSEGSGTKGSSTNITHLSAAIGQIYRNGQVIDATSGRGSRVMCFSQPYDTEPSMRGYSRNSYTKGLLPVQFIISQLEGSSRTIEMAQGTPKNGARAKNGVAATQNIVTSNNGEKMTMDGKLITTDFNNGYDPSKMVMSKGRSLPFNVAALADQICGECGWTKIESPDVGEKVEYVPKPPTKEVNNYLSTYEKSTIVGDRGRELEANAKPLLEPRYEDTAFTLARREFESGLLTKYIALRKTTDKKVKMSRGSSYLTE